jgi:hypothetical protein
LLLLQTLIRTYNLNSNTPFILYFLYRLVNDVKTLKESEFVREIVSNKVQEVFKIDFTTAFVDKAQSILNDESSGAKSLIYAARLLNHVIPDSSVPEIFVNQSSVVFDNFSLQVTGF